MSRFKFRLQKILEHRESIEDVKKSEYSKVKRRLDSEKDKLDKMKNQRSLIIEEKQNQVEQTITLNKLRIYNMYLKDIIKKIDFQEELIKDLKLGAENSRKELIEAMKDRKIIESLKGRDLREYLYEQKKEEEKMTDQFVSYRSSINIARD